MNDLKSDARSMITHYKRLGYKLEKESQVPYSYEMTRGSKVNPIIYISFAGISFKPYWE